MPTKTKNCARCNASFQYETVDLFDDNGFQNSFAAMKALLMERTLCDSCAEAEEREIAQKQKEADQRAHEYRWEKLCPPLYRATDLTHPGLHHGFRDAALGWNPSEGTGLGFLGDSGAGKTRLMLLAMRKGFDFGLSCQFLSHNQFSKIVIDAFSSSREDKSDARKQLDFLARCQLLFIDDLGKAPSTERADAELEELIEVRGSNLRPLLWTANGTGEWLMKRFGPDRGEPLVRRLADFTKVIKV